VVASSASSYSPEFNSAPSAITSRLKLFIAFSGRCCASNSLQMKTISFRRSSPPRPPLPGLSSPPVRVPLNGSRVIPFIYLPDPADPPPPRPVRSLARSSYLCPSPLSFLILLRRVREFKPSPINSACKAARGHYRVALPAGKSLRERRAETSGSQGASFAR